MQNFQDEGVQCSTIWPRYSKYRFIHPGPGSTFLLTRGHETSNPEKILYIGLPIELRMPTFKWMTNELLGISLPAICNDFQTIQHRSCNGTLGGRSFCQACGVRKEDLRQIYLKSDVDRTDTSRPDKKAWRYLYLDSGSTILLRSSSYEPGRPVWFGCRDDPFSSFIWEIIARSSHSKFEPNRRKKTASFTNIVALSSAVALLT